MTPRLAEQSRRQGDRLIVLGSIALFVVLVLARWYGGAANVSSVPGVDVGARFSQTGWQAFTDSRWLWLATVLVALVAVLLTGERGGRAVLATRALTALLAALSGALIVYRILRHRAGAAVAQATFHAAGALATGIWLGLAAAAAVGLGACLALVGSRAFELPAGEPAREAP